MKLKKETDAYSNSLMKCHEIEFVANDMLRAFQKIKDKKEVIYDARIDF